MTKSISRAFVLTALLFSEAGFSQNLSDIYQIALQADSELQIAESNYLSAVEAVPFARSANRPQMSLGVHRSYRQSNNSTSGNNTNQSYGYSVNLSQSLYDEETDSNIAAAEAGLEAEFARLQEARQSLILRVAESYFNILAAQDDVEFAYAERRSIERQLEQAQKRFEVGLIAITDVHEAQARYDSAVAQAILAENLLENSIQGMRVIIGVRPSSQLLIVGDGLELSLPNPADATYWVSLAEDKNPALQASRAQLNVAQQERRKQSTRQRPTVDLTASYSDASVNDDLLDDYRQDNVNVGVELNMPLFTGGRIDAERSRAEANYRSAQNSLLLQTRLTTQLVRNFYLGVVSGISQVNALKQALESSNIALQATRAGFEVGTRTSVDVLISLRETYSARRDYARARYDYLTNSLKLKQAAGILEEIDLTEIDRWLVP
ncbi:MAG: outer membrane protein [Gammaproteobacteria bacterium]|jgi:outer membrane protein